MERDEVCVNVLQCLCDWGSLLGTSDVSPGLPESPFHPSPPFRLFHYLGVPNVLVRPPVPSAASGLL